jgi:8-oxo-dGTP pyrophosphatase MutT (NUDIX family)
VKRVHVAAAVIRGADGRVLLARRADTNIGRPLGVSRRQGGG